MEKEVRCKTLLCMCGQSWANSQGCENILLYKVGFFQFHFLRVFPLLHSAATRLHSSLERVKERRNSHLGRFVHCCRLFFLSLLPRWRDTHAVYERDFWPADQRPACLHSQWFLSVNPICVPRKKGSGGIWSRPSPAPVKQKAVCGCAGGRAGAGRVASRSHTCVEREREKENLWLCLEIVNYIYSNIPSITFVIVCGSESVWRLQIGRLLEEESTRCPNCKLDQHPATQALIMLIKCKNK